MTYTTIHQYLGVSPGEITSEMLRQAVDDGVRESKNLDWKQKFPDIKLIRDSDILKDIAAFSNSGGGTLIFGVAEKDKAATGFVDCGDFTQQHERALRDAALTMISPPIHNLSIQQIMTEEADGSSPAKRAVVLIVPESVEVPHLLYYTNKSESGFRAPYRVDADTKWFNQTQLEAQFSARFRWRDQYRKDFDAFFADKLHIASRNGNYAWIIAVARPRTLANTARLNEEQSRNIFMHSHAKSEAFLESAWSTPLSILDHLNPRRRLRKWVLERSANDTSKGVAPEVAVHDDGTVVIATPSAAGFKRRGVEFSRGEFSPDYFEAVVLELALLARQTAATLGRDLYDVRIGAHWFQPGAIPRQPMTMPVRRSWPGASEFGDDGVVMDPFEDIEATIDMRSSDTQFIDEVRLLALDCINQGGVNRLRMIKQDIVQDSN